MLLSVSQAGAAGRHQAAKKEKQVKELKPANQGKQKNDIP
ncbi:hypothetical protein BLL52_4234 [Rhodoferax antarcticus ANT.BR]|uniref:Uncharacterized protein n=2 Tax=Rhodoferax antarcticus TaxID=81479 RepID=A0A1Q8Y9F7_9BURK|nr:hypothetical protein BLL52_4234 [Rhodoferax antarcticus ANT.BR]